MKDTKNEILTRAIDLLLEQATQPDHIYTRATMVLHISIHFDGQESDDHRKLAYYLTTRDWDDLDHLRPILTSSDVTSIKTYP